MENPERKIIVLVGKDAAGKTTLARAIADQFGKSYNFYWRDLMKKTWAIPEDADVLICEGVEAEFFRVPHGAAARVRIGGDGPIMRHRTARGIEYRNVPQLIVTMNHSLPDDLDPGIRRRLDVTTLTRTF